MAQVIAQSGVAFRLHDLRRTFITVADRLHISPYTLKRMVNHKVRGDVTGWYIVADVEQLGEPMQRITDYLLTAAGVRPGAQVLSLNADRGARIHATN